MSSLSRRDFVRTAALATVAARAVTSTGSANSPQGKGMANLGSAAPGAAPVRWLDGVVPAEFTGATWGLPWPRGLHAKGTEFAVRNSDGGDLATQSWPLAFWPDGSLKWTAHAVAADAPLGEHFEVKTGVPGRPVKGLSAIESGAEIKIDTGVIQARIARTGVVLVPELRRGADVIARSGRLVCQLEDRSDATVKRVVPFAGKIEQVTLEQAGPVRAVVKIEGRHAGANREWLPFVVRLYFYAGGENVRVMHTILFDGDHTTDFIAGLGLRFEVTMRGELHDRHVRFAGQDHGLFGEAVRGITGLRRDPGRAVKAAQFEGRATPPLAEWDQRVATRLSYIASYDEWTLVQPNADGFQIRKRTKPGYTWLMSAQGQRASGFGYVGTPTGGLGFGLKNFWQSYPAQLDIRGATTDAAEVTIWMWSPEAPAMDLRSYHDGLGQDTYEKQYNGGLEITYEDYEAGYDTPEGVGRTSEVQLWVLGATPSRGRLSALAQTVSTPPVITTTPDYLHACAVFGDIWMPVDRSTPAKAAIEDRLDWYIDFYRGQQEQRRWYGFWNYGDVMHTYDDDRHEWRYDVGGFAWDNSELSTDIWLWLQFLRSGRADLFRFAEAMTRHTGEVDVHHIGRFAPLGSRHNVLHWGCSAKQLRISTAVNRRYYYFLTGDERVGDLMREQVEAGRALVRVQPGRKLAHAASAGDLDRGATESDEKVGVSFGTDWGSIAGAWLTEWERTGSALMRDRLTNSMRTLGAQPHGFFSQGVTINLNDGEFAITKDTSIGVSHLNAVFGLVEVCAELNQLIDVPEFRAAWLDYCELYSASPEVQEARLGQKLNGNNLRQGHARLTAYASKKLGRPDLAERAWDEFKGNNRWESFAPRSTEITGPDVLRPVDEARGVSTNGTNQWGLSAIECLALVGDGSPTI